MKIRNGIVIMICAVVTMVLIMGWSINRQDSKGEDQTAAVKKDTLEISEDQKRINYLHQKEKAMY